jgi:AbrB family looped-hinge helix DNA binding protein
MKISSKNQITIPKDIASFFHLRKGDVLEIEKKDNKIIMIPKEVIYEDKYTAEDLQRAEKILMKSNPSKEITYESGDELIKSLKKRIKK